jgi:M6 family metalloprotease-like protein
MRFLLVLLWWTAPALAEGFLCAGFEQEDPTTPAISAAKPARLNATTTGTRQGLVLFARFKDDPANPVPTWAADLFDPDLPGSIAHFYHTMSFGKFHLRGEVAPRVYESSQPASAYLENDQTPEVDFGRFSLELLRQADQDIDFARFDNDGPDGVPNSGDDDGVVDAVFLVLERVPAGFLLAEATGIARLGFEDPLVSGDSGVGGQPIQVFSGQGTIQQGRTFAEAVGAICHEYGHVLGLPDLYNTAFLAREGAGPEEDSAGVGAWCLMGWGASGWNGDDGPNSFCAWSRMKLGWAQEEEIRNERQEVRFEEVGQRGQVVRVPLTGQEYFLVEYRKRNSTYYDRNLPGEGLLIWHVSRQRAENALTSQVVVDLECADGRWQGAGYPLGRVPDPQAGGDNLDFWAHDAEYTRAQGGNLGDATDPFDGVRFTGFTPQTNPASFAAEGGLSARIEGIHRDGARMVAQVQVAPLVVEIRNLALVDEDRDKLVLAGEQLRLHFNLANSGGLPARQVQVRLSSGDPWVVIERAQSRFGDLEPGQSSFGAPLDGFPTLSMVDGFIGTHRAQVVLEVYADSTLVNQQEFELVGISPRQQVNRVVVVDSLGNGDGLAQGGEFVSIEVELAQVDQPAPLRLFDFLLRSLHEGARPLSGPRLSYGAEQVPARSQRGPEFLLGADLEPETRLPFEFEVRGAFGSFCDTLTIEVAPGPDTTPPRVLGIQTRLVAGGVNIWLPSSQVLEGGQVRQARARIYTLADTSAIAEVPLEARDKGYEGTWSGAGPGTYLAEAVVEDQAGNQGRSRLLAFPVLALSAPTEAPRPSGWEEVSLPHEGHRPYVRSLIRAPGNPEVLYAGGTQGAWRSVDGGQTWDRLGYWYPSLMVDAVDPFTLYRGGLKSRDGGHTWQLLDAEVIPLVMDPVRAGWRLGFRRSPPALVVSGDGGATWQATSLDTIPYPLLVHPGNPEVIYGGGLQRWNQELSRSVADVLWRSRDNGQTWEQQPTPRPYTSLVVDPGAPVGLYATSQGDTLWHSSDGGDTWEALKVMGWEFAYYTQVQVHPQDPRILFFAELYGLGRLAISRDAGQTWQQFQTLYAISDVILHPRDPGQFFLVVSSYRQPASLIQTRDGGEHWEPVYLPEAQPQIGTVIFGTQGQVLAGSGRLASGENTNILPGFYRSEDQGRQWTWEGYKLEMAGGGVTYSQPVSIETLHQDPFEPLVLLGVIGGLVVRSADGGRYWQTDQTIRWGGSWGAASFTADHRRPGVCYFAGGGIWRSEDYGETWERRAEGVPRQVYASGYESPPSVNGLILDTGPEPDLLCAAVGDSLWQSRDEGQHWQYTGKVREGEQIRALVVHPEDERQWYALTTGGVYVSQDLGRSWSLRSALSLARFERLRLRFDPRDPQRALLVNSDQLWESRDGARTWRSIGATLEEGMIFNDAAIDPAAPNLVYAATNAGLFRLDTDQEITAVEETATTPTAFALSPAYPNPFNPSTTLRFSLPQPGEAELSIYNLMGQRVAILIRGSQEAGAHVLQWHGRDDQGRELASGVYLCRLRAGRRVETRKVLLLR